MKNDFKTIMETWRRALKEELGSTKECPKGATHPDSDVSFLSTITKRGIQHNLDICNENPGCRDSDLCQYNIEAAKRANIRIPWDKEDIQYGPAQDTDLEIRFNKKRIITRAIQMAYRERAKVKKPIKFILGGIDIGSAETESVSAARSNGNNTFDKWLDSAFDCRSDRSHPWTRRASKPACSRKKRAAVNFKFEKYADAVRDIQVHKIALSRRFVQQITENLDRILTRTLGLFTGAQGMVFEPNSIKELENALTKPFEDLCATIVSILVVHECSHAVTNEKWANEKKGRYSNSFIYGLLELDPEKDTERYHSHMMPWENKGERIARRDTAKFTSKVDRWLKARVYSKLEKILSVWWSKNQQRGAVTPTDLRRVKKKIRMYLIPRLEESVMMFRRQAVKQLEDSEKPGWNYHSEKQAIRKKVEDAAGQQGK